MKKFLIVFTIFIIDRIVKIYLINLQAAGTDIDFYILPFLNFYLVWNTGIGFGLISMESNIYYHILTTIIGIVNIGLIYFVHLVFQKEIFLIRYFLFFFSFFFQFYLIHEKTQFCYKQICINFLVFL